jgi:hypothetical protein
LSMIDNILEMNTHNVSGYFDNDRLIHQSQVSFSDSDKFD